ncbi:MAG: MarR family transcriptional regulator [Tunicatimonas sp.]
MTDDIESVILFQLDKASKTAKQYSQREFERLGFGITVEQWILLKIIHESDGISQRELADQSFRDPASITRTLDLLHVRGFIDRLPVPENRRQYRILLTKKGEQFVAAHMPTIQQHRQKSVEGISVKDLKKLSALLQKIQKNMA